MAVDPCRFSWRTSASGLAEWAAAGRLQPQPNSQCPPSGKCPCEVAYLNFIYYLLMLARSIARTHVNAED